MMKLNFDFLYSDNLHYEKLPDGSVKCIEDEIPFELPERWEWCRLGVITEIYGRIGFRGYTKDDLVEIGEGAITLSPSNIINSKLDFSSCTYISWVKYDESPEIQLAKNDIVLVKTGSSYGKSAIVDKLPEKTTLNPQFVVLKNTKINSSYACMYLQSTHSQNLFREFVVGTAIPTFSQKALSTLLISCPPISEQHRIVEKLNELLSFVDTIESDKTDLQATIQATKSKILDLAIRGKLVPQDPNDEPASVLLERIKAEKEELIKQGKIKRDKKESVIFKGEDNSYYEKYHDGKLHCLDDELPFELPKGWEWCNLSMIGSTNIGLTYRPTDIVTDGVIVLRSCNIVNDQIDLNDLVRVQTTIRDNQFAQENDILICARNGSKALVGKCALIPDFGEQASFGAFMAIYRTKFYEYIVHFIRSNYFRSIFDDSNSTAINQLTQDMLKRAIVPFPPLTEQYRIVTAIKLMMTELNQIEKSLN